MKSRKRTLNIVIAVAVVSALLAAGIFFWLAFGIDRSGWIEKNGKYSYLDSRGRPITGWHEEGGSRYYFGTDGIMLTGWQNIDGTTCWFSPAGVQHTGWIEEDGQRWYLTSDSRLLTGWQDVDGRRRYFLPDGALATGWQTIDGSRYYLDDEGSILTGWLYTTEGVYHLTESGHLSTGLTEIDGKTYYFFDTSGLMLQGWLDWGEHRYYFDETGAMATGWQIIDGQRRFFAEDGTLTTGWIQQGEYRYYIKDDGTAATGPTEIDGETHYFTPDGIYVLLVNGKNPIPQGYDVELVRYGQWGYVAADIRDQLDRMITDAKATGINVYLNCGYRNREQQKTILDNRTKEGTDKGMDYHTAYAKALETVALPGYSEHHTGYAVDVVCSVAPTWLHEHCWEYGFIVRYPEDKSYYTGIAYEHWHYRYVGVEVAKAITESGLCLEEYLGAEPLGAN